MGAVQLLAVVGLDADELGEQALPHAEDEVQRREYPHEHPQQRRREAGKALGGLLGDALGRDLAEDEDDDGDDRRGDRGTPLDVRTNSGEPSASSKCRTAWLTAGCEMASSSAANVILFCFPT